ncbi:E3 ubiquitin-protein ligase RNF135 [Leptodactylus fuscus]|uniref:E3 ubiquitin-protein ligase RNF135 n=1 Tax=Leptodactylus fuscus TaxID=238119 RepID=UPI003F4F1A7F
MEEKQLILRLQPEDLSCTVCFNFYVHPSTLPCGHTFCKCCIEKYWTDHVKAKCPLCQTNFKERPELNKNTILSALLDTLQAQDSSTNVHCPSCNGSEAMRLCLPCGAPLCKDHLMLHKDPTGRQRHLLVNLITTPWPCLHHDRGLEYFCELHGTPLCPTCVPQHDECRPVHLMELYKRKRENLEKTISDMEQKITNKKQMISKQKDAYREIQIVICDIKDNLTRDFREMRDYLEKQERAAFWRMKQEQDGAQRETSQLVQKLISELDDIKRQKEKMEEQLENDWMSVLMDVGPKETSTSLPGSRSPYTFDENRLVDTTDAVTQMKQSLLSHALLEKAHCPPKQVLEDSLVLSPTSLQPCEQEAGTSVQGRALNRLLQWATDVSFDPDTVSCRLSLSPDLKTVTVADKNCSYARNERRFTSCQALCSEGFSTGCIYWEVSTTEIDGWGIGVAAAEITKSQQLGDSDLSWCIKWNKNRLSAWHNNEEIRIDLLQPSIVGVLLNCTEKLVSFYSVAPGMEQLIHTFRLHFQTQVFPAVWLYGLKKGKSLTIRDLEKKAA